MPAWSVPGCHSTSLPAHALEARQDVLQRVVERVAHVQRAGDVGRRDHDRIGLGAAPLRTTGQECARLLPGRIDAALDLGRQVGFFHRHRGLRRGRPKSPPGRRMSTIRARGLSQYDALSPRGRIPSAAAPLDGPGSAVPKAGPSSRNHATCRPGGVRRSVDRLDPGQLSATRMKRPSQQPNPAIRPPSSGCAYATSGKSHRSSRQGSITPGRSAPVPRD